MFDNLEKNNQTPVQDSNKKSTPPGIEDIFADTEKPQKPEVFRPKSPDSIPQSVMVEEESSSVIKKIALIAGAVLVVGAIGYGGYWGYANFFQASPEVNNIENTNVDNNETFPTNDITQDATQSDVKQENQEEVVAPTADQLLDSDQDGLTDEEENILGTNINNIDSDDDGLFDREEVKVYKTNPLSADTDGDGYSDGDEVKNGYNPNGPGKLYELK